VRSRRRRVVALLIAVLLGVVVVGGVRSWSQWWPRDGAPPWDEEPDYFGTQLWVESLGRTQALVEGTVTDDGGTALPFSRWATVTVTPSEKFWTTSSPEAPEPPSGADVAVGEPVRLRIARSWGLDEGDRALIGVSWDYGVDGPVASLVVPLDPDADPGAGPDDERAAWELARQLEPGADARVVARTLAEDAQSPGTGLPSQILARRFGGQFSRP
jgi:hypothetical protein